jgi:transcription elongation factor GreA
VTLAFRARLEAEVRALEEELHFHLPKQIKEAREHGDLSENAEYEAAKERQGYVGARLAQLKARLADLSMVSLDNIPADRVSLGSEVVVVDLDTEKEARYELVVSEDADAAHGKVSTGSPIGRALMGARVGDEVSVHTPLGEREFAIRELRTIHERDSS